MPQLISKTESDQSIVYVFIAEGQTTETRFEITKTTPPKWIITPPSEELSNLTWATLVTQMDALTGAT